MNRYLSDTRYPFVPKLAQELNTDPTQTIVDCILADGLDAGVVHRIGWSLTGIDEIASDTPYKLERRFLRESTKKRLAVTSARARRMGSSVLEHVDSKAEWDVRTMQASWRICEVSVEGNVRQDGRPYSMHPLEATAVLYEAIKRAQTETKIPRRDLIALLATCLMHDSVEDWVKGANHYNLDSAVNIISPLVILQVLQKTGLGGSRPSYVANAARLMTHEKGQPWMHNYQEYISRLSSNFLGAIVKPSGDNYHNYQVDRLPEPSRKEGEPEQVFMSRLVKYTNKQKILANIIFGDGITNAPNKKNAYRHDKRAIEYGMRILTCVRGIVETEGDRTKYPHVDWNRAVPLDRFRAEVLPEYVENLRNDFCMPLTTLDAA